MLAGVLAIAGGLRYMSGHVSVSSNVNGRELPIYCVDTDEKKVALSFDAAWGNEDTRQILDILKKHDIQVTFFMTGGWVESFPDDVKAIQEAGHDLGNHSENHKNMSQLSDEQKTEELMKVHEKVKILTGEDMELFRPPYGDYDDDVVLNATKNGYFTIQWDVDSLDWKDYGVDSIIDTVVNHKNLGNGSIILCHNGAKYTAQALESLITGLHGCSGRKAIACIEILAEKGLLRKEERATKNGGNKTNIYYLHGDMDGDSGEPDALALKGNEIGRAHV